MRYHARGSRRSTSTPVHRPESDYGDRIALDGVTFEAPSGGIFGLLGPNGSGKSTLFKILSTALAPGSGTARIGEVDIRNPDECASAPLPLDGHDAIPLPRLLDNATTLDPRLRYLLVCAHGIRSRAAAEQLRAGGRGNVWSLRGGLARQG